MMIAVLGPRQVDGGLHPNHLLFSELRTFENGEKLRRQRTLEQRKSPVGWDAAAAAQRQDDSTWGHLQCCRSIVAERI